MDFNMIDELMNLLKKQQAAFETHVEKTNTEILDIKDQLSRCNSDRISMLAQMHTLTDNYKRMDRKLKRQTKKAS
jgi:septal ring factor EnvC (AmiA/AmiB activator)